MKTEPMAHQVVGLDRLAQMPDAFALGAEQGTGKTWMFLADAERQYTDDRIECLLVIAPKGVHINWVKREIKKHVGVAYRADYVSSGLGVRHKRRIERLLKPWEGEEKAPLVIVAMNFDAATTKQGNLLAMQFLRRFKTMIVIDESHKIKNHKAARTKKITTLGEYAVSKRIGSGTLVGNSPADLFGQYEFLKSGILGTTSYRTFISEYCELLPPNSRVVRNAAARRFSNALKGLSGDAREARLTQLMDKTKSIAQINKTNSDGNPIYKNLDKLKQYIAPYTYRVLKEDCLDLPEKIMQSHYFDLAPAHKRYYDYVRDNLHRERDDGDVDIYTSLTVVTKLQQITSGYVLEDGAPVELSEPDAGLLSQSDERLSALLDALEIVPDDKSVIIWVRYREEIRRIVEILPVGEVVQYHGGINEAAREQAVDDFQEGVVKYLVVSAAAGGTGLTLTRAEFNIYYSQSFSYFERSQSEDRSHRIGTVRPVVYIDIVANDTMDERVTDRLQFKRELASKLLDDL